MSAIDPAEIAITPSEVAALGAELLAASDGAGSQLAMREVRARIVADLLDKYPQPRVERFLARCCWTPATRTLALHDAAADRIGGGS